MRHLIALALLRILRRVLPARGAHRAPTRPAPGPIRIELAGQYCAPWAQGEAPYHQNACALVRPYIDREAWRAELDEMQRQFARREALRAAGAGLPDPGYTYPGAHTLAGAVV
ncbi:hypothetical protein [Kitasatospora sp. HPMI-4]|uniref:hypothetical protein n=1 Tax=Kitasatospora sp. HPMI-4 TaxID=3448443 RepID=UPI003F1E3D25